MRPPVGSWSDTLAFAVRVLVVLGACWGCACAKDVVLPDLVSTEVCGDGIVEPGEQCDNTSPGCVDCIIAPNWVCPDNVCSPVCGDGVIGVGSSCTSIQRDSACDMTGYWAARETDYELDPILGSVQTSSNWFLFQFAQTGNAFEVVESLDCGIHVTGSVTVDYTPEAQQAIMYLNRMDAQSPQGARTGTSMPSGIAGDAGGTAGGGCDVSFERWYAIRGGVEDLLPPVFSTLPPLTSLPALPSVSDPITSTAFPAGATDPDGDGIPGIAFAITGFITGTRNSVQRDWKGYATTVGTPAPTAAVTFSVPGGFDMQESVMRVTDCGDDCALLETLAHVANDIPDRITFSFIGKTYGSPRVSAVVAGVPRQSLDADLTTCANVRLVLPHDASLPSAPDASP